MLIILAAVTIISVQNSGLVDRTIGATEEYAQAQESENAEMDSLDDRMSSLTSTIDAIRGGNGTGGGSTGGTTDPIPEDEDAGKDDPDSVYSVLKVGDYVKLNCTVSGAPEEIMCRVLYDKDYNTDKSTNYGIQLVSNTTITTIAVGYDDPMIETSAPDEIKNADIETNEGKMERLIWSFNNALIQANKVDQDFSGDQIRGTRIFGTIPDNPTKESGIIKRITTTNERRYGSGNKT